MNLNHDNIKRVHVSEIFPKVSQPYASGEKADDLLSYFMVLLCMLQFINVFVHLV